MEPRPGKGFIRSDIAGRETHDDIEFRRELADLAAGDGCELADDGFALRTVVDALDEAVLLILRLALDVELGNRADRCRQSVVDDDEFVVRVEWKIDGVERPFGLIRGMRERLREGTRNLKPGSAEGDGANEAAAGWVLVIDGMNRVQLCLRSERVLLSGSLGFYSRMARFLFDDGYSLTNDSAIRDPPSGFAAVITKSSSKIIL